MLRKLGALLGIRFELDDLSRAATELQSRIEAAVSENDELVTYLQQLESTTPEAESVEAAAEDHTPVGEPPSASEVLSELEEFLRDYQERQRQDDKDR
jgi:hypothetical protein